MHRKKHHNANILIIPAPATFKYPATKNVWDYLRILCKNVFIINKDKNAVHIISEDPHNSIKLKPPKGLSDKIKNNLCILLESHRRGVNTILLYQSFLDPMSLLLAKILGKKLLIFIGGSRVQVFKANLSSRLCTPSEIIKHVLEDVILYFLNLLLADKLILVYNKLCQTDTIISFFKYKIKVAYGLPSKDFFNEFKPQHDITKRANIICFVGSPRFVKGFHIFVSTARLVSRRRKDIMFLVIGTYADYSNSEPKRLCEFLKKLEINSANIRFLGKIPHSMLSNYLGMAKLLVMPSFSEGLPAVAIEAMACGTPVLATPVGALRDLIKDGLTGFIIRKNSPECISKQILQILEDTERLKKVSKNASRFIRNILSFKKSLNMWRKVLMPQSE